MDEAQSLPQSIGDQGTKAVHAWILVLSLGLIYLINMGFPMYGGSVANTYMSEATGMSKSSLGAGFSLFTLFQGISGIVVLLSIRRIGVKLTLLLGCLLLLIGATFMRFGVTTTWHYVIVFGVIMGLGVGFGTVLPITTSITTWFTSKRAMAMAIVLALGGIGGVVAAPLVDRVVNESERGWQAGWELVIFATAVSCLITILFVRDRKNRTPSASESDLAVSTTHNRTGRRHAVTSNVYRTPRDWKTADALRSPTLWLFAIGSLGFVAPFMLCVAHSAQHLRDLGIAPSTASMALGLLTAFSIAGRLIAGFLGDRIEPRILWSVFLLLMAGGCLALTQASTISVVVVYTMLVGLGFGGAFVCRTITIGNYFGAAPFASINGILGTILTIFAATAPLVGGLVRDSLGSYTLAFVGIAILSTIGSLCLLAVRNPKGNRVAGSG